MDITTLLTNLQLQPSTTQPPQKFNNFTLFPSLPTELRLKILSHALPAFTTLNVRANITIADPSSGLYLLFAPTISVNVHSVSRFTYSNVTQGLSSLKPARNLNLMLVNQEFRDYYIETFPLSLPTGRRGRAKIRFSPHETIHLRNFDTLQTEWDFVRALKSQYALQPFWHEIKKLAVPIVGLPITQGSKATLRPAEIVRRFEGLEELRAYMWDNFESQVTDEKARAMLRGGMIDNLEVLRRGLEELVEAEASLDGSSEYAIPKLVLE